MNLRFVGLAGCLLLLASVQSIRAAEMIRLMGIEGRSVSDASLPAVFGNREEALNLEVEPAISQSGYLRADLFQTAGTLAMPLAKDLHVQDALTLTSGAPQHLRISIKFPDVKKQANVVVRLSLAPSGAPAHALPLGDLRFEVFPASLTKELADLLKPHEDGVAPAFIFGQGNGLRTFFKSASLVFEDGGESTPDRLDPGRLYFVETTDKNQTQLSEDRRAGLRLAVFSPDESLPPGIYAERSSSGVFIHVTLPLLDNLKDNPRAQLALIKIIHLLADSPPPAN